MRPTDLAFALLAANPFGGLLVAIPFAILKLHYPTWLAIAVGTPLAYIQVPVVDATWSLLARIPSWGRLLEKRRSPRVARLVAARGAFWITFLATPFLGPWLVMAFMRYAHVGQRRVALPILAALACTAAALAWACILAPRMFAAMR
jgi:xanthosine utilization system XapX-like protein